MKLLDQLKNQNDEAQKEQQLKARVKRIELQAQADLLETQSKLEELKEERSNLLLQEEYSVAKEIALDIEIESYERGIERLEKKLEDLF